MIPRLEAGATQFADLSSESRLANREVERRTGVEVDPGLLALVSGGPANVERVRARIERDPAVARTVVDRDGVILGFLHARGGGESKDAADRLIAAFAGDPHVRLGGGAIAARQVTEAIRRDLRRAELIAFPLVLLLSFWIFRGLVAAFLPPLVGAGAIGLTFLGLRIAVEVHPLSIFALNLVTGLGLGLAIDYSLFIVSRWREEAAQHGHGPRRSRRRCEARAGRSSSARSPSRPRWRACSSSRSSSSTRWGSAVPSSLSPPASSRSCRCPPSSTGSARASTLSPRAGCSRCPRAAAGRASPPG